MQLNYLFFINPFFLSSGLYMKSDKDNQKERRKWRKTDKLT